MKSVNEVGSFSVGFKPFLTPVQSLPPTNFMNLYSQDKIASSALYPPFLHYLASFLVHL